MKASKKIIIIICVCVAIFIAFLTFPYCSMSIGLGIESCQKRGWPTKYPLSTYATADGLLTFHVDAINTEVYGESYTYIDGNRIETYAAYSCMFGTLTVEGNTYSLHIDDREHTGTLIFYSNTITEAYQEDRFYPHISNEYYLFSAKVIHSNSKQITIRITSSKIDGITENSEMILYRTPD
jgi:hypothetical protein